MPKRPFNENLANAATDPETSICMDDPSKLLEDEKNEQCNQNTTKRMLYMPSNQNNEVERLLMYNSKTLICMVDHSDFPAFNVGVWPQENCDMLTHYPKCAFTVPRPLFIADKQCEKIDICYKRPMKRHFFKVGMKTTRTAYQTALKSNKNIRSSIKDNIYHYSVFEMAERIYMQPDPYFQSNYDCYFTGGNLSILPTGSILHAGGDNLQKILISEFPETDEYTDFNSLLNVASSKNYGNCEMFEFHPLLMSLNNSEKNSFIARQRNLITFNYFTENNQIKTVTKFRTKSTPFISFAQSERDINKFIITTMKQHVRVYDLSGSTPVLVNTFEISPNAKEISWNTVKPWRENTFMYANEKKFFMIDIRTTPDQWLKEAFISNKDMICENISALMPSDIKNLFYVATNHKLHCMDIRYLNKHPLSDSLGGISRWTHQLRYAPLMMDKFRLRQTEYIALSSPIAGDLHICQLSRERNSDNISLDSSVPGPKHIYSSLCLPYQPPTLLEAYKNARLSGKCLRAEANLEARIKCCTTGMKFFKPLINNLDSDIGLLLISNSNGDVFAHTLSKREDEKTEVRCNKQSDDMMMEFEQKLCNQAPQPLSYTEIKNMKGLRKVFLCKGLSAGKKFDLDEMDSEYSDDPAPHNNTANAPRKSNPKRRQLGLWQKSLTTLHSYKDALVADLLSIWDIDIEEENKLRLGNLNREAKAEPAIKVESWLQQNIAPGPPMLSIPLTEVIRRTDNNDTSNIFDTSLNISQTQNTIDFGGAIHSTQILNDNVNNSGNFDTSAIAIKICDGSTTTDLDKIKSKKKTKKYVKGF